MADADDERTGTAPRPAPPLIPGPTPEAPPQAVPRRGPRPLVPVRESIDQYSEPELRQLAEWVASDGLLRTDDELVSEIFTVLPFKRMGARIRTRLEAVAKRLRRRRGRDGFA